MAYFTREMFLHTIRILYVTNNCGKRLPPPTLFFPNSVPYSGTLPPTVHREQAMAIVYPAEE